jgi:uncharacterized membrane protein
MKTTILGGVLFLAPLAVLIILLGKVYQIGLTIVQPIDAVLPVKTMAGIAVVNILAVLAILLVCYLAGHLAKRQFLGSRLQTFDGMLTDAVPGYAVFKSTLGSVSRESSGEDLLKPVLVRFDDYEQIAFEVERSGKHAVVFLPGTPSVWVGDSVIVETERLTELDLPTFNAMRLQRVFGRGSLAARESALPPPDMSGAAR